MTETDELRRLLDERGVEWMPSVWSAKDETFYKVEDVGYLATELSSGKMKVCIEGYMTPKQTIEATLGRSECHMTEMRFPYENDGGYWLKCDQCGFMLYMRDWWQPVRFCSHCGAKVVDE